MVILKIILFSMDPLQNGLSMLFKRKNKTSVENSIAVVGVTKALLIGTHSIPFDRYLFFFFEMSNVEWKGI